MNESHFSISTWFQGLHLTGVDDVIIVLILLSMMWGFWRGFLREALSLAVWATAFWMAITFSKEVSLFFTDQLKNENTRLYVSAALLFLATLLVGAFIHFLIIKFFKKTGFMGGFNRWFGAFFGFLRGLLVVAVFIFCLGFTNLIETQAWKSSRIIPVFTMEIKKIEDWWNQGKKEH